MTTPLKLDGPTIADIYLGKITKWNDPAIAGQNAGVTLPSADIVVVHRSDGSGTSYVFTDYLSNVSADWKAGPGTSKNPQWPVGLGGQGNEGVTQQVKQNKNSIGYVELVYAIQNKLPAAQVKNKSGDYVTPSTDTTSLAAAGVAIPGGLPHEHRQLADEGRVPDLELHVHPALQGPAGRGEGEGARRPALVGDPRRTEDDDRARLRAAADGCRDDGREDADDGHHVRRPAGA